VEELLVDFGASTTATIGGGVANKERAARQCDVCEDDIATRHCGDCKKISFFCDDCFEVSHKKAKNVSHQSTTVEERLKMGGSKTVQVPLALCKVHREPLKLYCDDCAKVACLECGTFDATHTPCFLLGGCTCVCKFARVHAREYLCLRVFVLLEYLLHVSVLDARLLCMTGCLDVNGSSFVFVSTLTLNTNISLSSMLSFRPCGSCGFDAGRCS
jgi:hypothetical protein